MKKKTIFRPTPPDIAQAIYAGRLRAEGWITHDPAAGAPTKPLAPGAMIPYGDYCYLRDLHGECTAQMETAYRDAFNAAMGGRHE